MEKVMSVEERIKRAEDIYNKRNGVKYAKSEENTRKSEKKGGIKKLLMHIFICLVIYVVFYAVNNREYIFSEEFRNEATIFFTEKTHISKWYSNVRNYINEKFNIREEENTDNDSEKSGSKDKIESENKDNIESKSNNNEENIGGAQDENIPIEDAKQVEENGEDKTAEGEISKEAKIEITEEEQMRLDAEDIKSRISFIKPIEGRISSTFGWRNPTTSTVPKYHTGIDIASVEGTIIKSATDGKVIMVSSHGDYGNHYKIQIEDIIIIYAHCKKLYLKEGDSVTKGQEIAEVGSTGNSTGPHLHFEIRKGDKKIDPQLILNI